EQIVALLGIDAYLVPCKWGTKAPLVTYVERPFEGTKTEAYRALFEAEPTNIAVYLGAASGGLCAIDFDADEDLAAFLALNPKLTASARSRGSRGGMVWVRIVSGERTSNAEPRTSNFEGQAEKAESPDYPPSCNTEH